MKPHKQRDAKLSSLTTTLHLHPSSRAPDASDAIIPLTKRVHARETHWFRSLRALTSVLTTVAIVNVHTSLPNTTQEAGYTPKPHTTRHRHLAQKTRPRLRTAPRWLVIWSASDPQKEKCKERRGDGPTAPARHCAALDLRAPPACVGRHHSG